MNSKLVKLQTLFNVLPPEERKAFTLYVRDYVRSQSFNLHKLLASKEDDGIKCPHCQVLTVVKYGVRKGIQWYKCKSCGKTFSLITNSFLQGTKKDFYVWKTFFKSMMDGLSVRRAATLCKINRNTAFKWRHKILDALAQYHEKQHRMKGVVEADDTFFPVSYKGSTPVGRPARRRGTSKEKVCVSCAVDRSGHLYSKVSALGRSTAKALQHIFGKRISKQAVVCTDNDRAYVRFAKNSLFEHVRVPNGIRLLGIYHVQNINAYHSRLKAFIAKFKGVSTKYLNNYLVWNNVIQEGKRSRITLLKLCVRAVLFTRCRDFATRSAVPLPVVA